MTDQPAIDESLVEQLAAPLGERLSALRDRISAAGGDNVQLLPVSKAHPVEAVVAGQRHGLTTFGENYAQELAAKHSTLAADAPSFHFIGQLQRNKVRQIATAVTVWQSVDRIRVADEIAKRAPGAHAFAQVNLADDPGKAGCNFEDLPELVDHMQTIGLQVDGLMGVGTAADDAATAAGFRRLRTQADAMGLSECSMGMTADLELAIEEGSTMVRIGTALFGARQ